MSLSLFMWIISWESHTGFLWALSLMLETCTNRVNPCKIDYRVLSCGVHRATERSRSRASMLSVPLCHQVEVQWMSISDRLASTWVHTSGASLAPAKLPPYSARCTWLLTASMNVSLCVPRWPDVVVSLFAEVPWHPNLCTLCSFCFIVPQCFEIDCP